MVSRRGDIPTFEHFYICNESKVFIPAFNIIEAHTRFSDSGGIQGWVDVGLSYN